MSNYIETWKCVASAIGRSERWCRMVATRANDPLPVFKFGGMVRIEQEELDAWMQRQRVRPLARPVAEAIGSLRLIA